MANIPHITISYSWFFCEEQCSGERCAVCDDQIFGNGFRIVMSTTIEQDVLPKFRELPTILCSSCKEGGMAA